MSAVLKKLAVSLLTDKKVLKTIGGIILGIMVMIAMPIAAVIALFRSDIQLDMDELRQQVEAELSGEDLAGSTVLMEKLSEIEAAMTAAGFAEYAESAKNVSIVFLSSQMNDAGFATKLAGCYQEGQTNESLLSVINAAFGTAVTLDDLMAVAGDQTIETEAETTAEASNEEIGPTETVTEESSETEEKKEEKDETGKSSIPKETSGANYENMSD